MYSIEVALPAHRQGQLDRILVLTSPVHEINLYAWDLNRVLTFTKSDVGIRMELCPSCAGSKDTVISFLMSKLYLNSCMVFLCREAKIHHRPTDEHGALVYQANHMCGISTPPPIPAPTPPTSDVTIIRANFSVCDNGEVFEGPYHVSKRLVISDSGSIAFESKVFGSCNRWTPWPQRCGKGQKTKPLIPSTIQLPATVLGCRNNGVRSAPCSSSSLHLDASEQAQLHTTTHSPPNVICPPPLPPKKKSFFLLQAPVITEDSKLMNSTQDESKIRSRSVGDMGGDMARSEGDMARSKGDMARSEGDMARSEGDMARSEGDMARSEGDMARSEGDMARSGGDMSRSGEDMARSGEDMSRSGGDMVRSVGDMVGSEGDMSRSGEDMARSGGDMSRSGGDMARPGGDMVRSGGDRVRSEANSKLTTDPVHLDSGCVCPFKPVALAADVPNIRTSKPVIKPRTNIKKRATAQTLCSVNVSVENAINNKSCDDSTYI